MREPEHPEQMKIAQEIIAEVAEKRLDPEQAKALLKEIEEQAQLEAEAAASLKEPAVKKQFVVLLSDPTGKLIEEYRAGLDRVGWIFQIPEDSPPDAVADRLIAAAYNYNTSKKGRRYPVCSIGETCEAVGPRFLKEYGIAVKTKVPISIIPVSNALPEVASDFKEAV